MNANMFVVMALFLVPEALALVAAVAVIVLVIGFVVTACAITNAPLGFEDRTGFHIISP